MDLFPIKAARSPRFVALLVAVLPYVNVGLALLVIAIGYTLLPGDLLRLDRLFYHFPGLLGAGFVVGDPFARSGQLSRELEAFFQRGGEVTSENLRTFLLETVVALMLLASLYMLIYVPAVHALARWVEPQDFSFAHWLVDVPAALLAYVFTYFIPSVSALFRAPAVEESNLERGTEVVTVGDMHAALQESRLSKPPTGDILPWGGLNFFESEIEGHFAVTGTTGSGKTLTIRMLLQQALLDETGALRRRVLMFDGKTDFYPILRGMGIPEEQIHVLHPFDKRSSAWDIAADLVSPQSAKQFSALLVPPVEGEAHPFFANEARQVLARVLDAFRTTVKSPWGLSDIINTALDESKLELVLSRTEAGRLKLANLRNARVKSDVLSTLYEKAEVHELTARLWVRATNKFSFTDWMDDDKPPSVLLLASDSRASESLNPINQLFFSHAADLTLNQAEEKVRTETWFVLDEFAALGHLGQRLGDLLSKSRSKRIHVILGFQDISGVRAVYREDLSDSLINQCSNFAVFRNTNESTREWASRLFGSKEEFITQTFGESQHTDGSSSSTSQNTTLHDRRAIAPSEFLAFPAPSPTTGIFGAFRTASHGWMDTVPPTFVSLFLRPPSKDPSFVPRDVGDQEDVSWSAALSAELHATPEPPDDTPSQLRSLD